MDTNSAGKFKPKPPPKPTFDGRLSINKPEVGKKVLQNKKSNNSPIQKVQTRGTLPRDQKPPLLPKPQCLNKAKLSPDSNLSIYAATSSSFIILPPVSPVPSNEIHRSSPLDDIGFKEPSDDRTEIHSQMKSEINEFGLLYSSESFTREYSVKSCMNDEGDLARPLSSFVVKTQSSVEENQTIPLGCGEVDRSSFCDNFMNEKTGFSEPSTEIIDHVNISKISNIISTIQSNFNNDQTVLNHQSDVIVDNFSSSGSSEHCDKDTSSLQPERTSLKDSSECIESGFKSLSFINRTTSGDLDSQSSDSSCGSFTVISSDCVPEQEGNVSNQASNNSSDLCNQSFLYSLDCLNKSQIDSSVKLELENETKKLYSDNQFSIKSVMTSVIETSTPVAAESYSMRSLNSKSDSVSLRERVESVDNFTSQSWTEDEVSKDNSNFTDIEGGEGSVSVRRRLSTWFGSFGKGSKQKDKRESSLFYCDQSDSVVSGSNFDSDILNQANNNPDDQLLKVPTDNVTFDPDNNRSSVSEESGEIDQHYIYDSVGLPTDRKQRKSFYVARELMTSEKVFIDVLKLLCFDFKDFIKSFNKDVKTTVIPDDEFDKIIASLPQLLRLSEDLFQDLETRISSWSQLPKISDVIVKKGPFLKLFSVYIQNFESQCNFLDECCHKYPRFTKALKSFEMSDRCKKLSVKHYMLKPVQRIPQYRLLLDDYLAHLDEGSDDYDDTQVALNIVSDVANHANKSIKNGDHLCKLLQLQSQLGNYEIIRPWRRFVKEGELCKLSRKENQLRYFILLNDCLLYTSFYGSMTGLRVKYELPLNGMKVTVPQVEDCNTEFSIITSTRSFTLRARSEEECNEWVTALQNSIKENNNRQLTFVNMKFVAKNAAAETIKLGKEAPIWIQDKRVTMCQICTAVFTVTFRRHHCRACGKVVCGSCSENKAPLQYMKFQTARVCDECHNYLLKEFDDPESNMYDIIKTELCLTDYDAVTNAIEHIRSSFKKQTSSIKKIRKYVPSRLKEVTANDTGSQMSGWLYRRGKRSWKRLWFVLKEQVLYIYKASEDIVAVESIPILGYKIECDKEGTFDDTDLEHIFQLTHANQHPLVFGTESQHSANKWISAFEEAIVLK